MEISIRRVARASSLSGEPFEEGSLVECFLFRDQEGSLERADLRPDEVERWEKPGDILCRWRHRLRPPAESAAEARRQSLASAEEMFLGLLESEEVEVEEADEAKTRERCILLNLLALLLERKRVLKARRGSPGSYLYVPDKRPVEVPVIELRPEEIAPLVSELENLL